MTIEYTFRLPVHTQGEDFDFLLEKSGNPIQALQKMATQYRQAAAQCEQLGAALEQLDLSQVTFQGDGTWAILIEGPEQLLRPLEDQKLVIWHGVY